MGREIVLGNLTIDPDRYEVFVDGRPINLTFIEFQLLLFLTLNAGRVVSHERIFAELWDSRPANGRRRLTVHISRLRKKIAASNPYALQTFTKRGYGIVTTGSAGLVPPSVALDHVVSATGEAVVH